MFRIILACYALATSLALVVLKYGTKNGLPISVANNKVHFDLNLYSVGGIFLYGVSFLLYIYLISKYDLGYIIPLTTAIVYVLIFVASYFVFKESFTTQKVVGILLIMSGILLLNLKK